MKRKALEDNNSLRESSVKILDSFELWLNLENTEQTPISSNLQNSIDLNSSFQDDESEVSSISCSSSQAYQEDSLEESLMLEQQNKEEDSHITTAEINILEPVILNPETITITIGNQLPINDDSLWHRLHLDFNSDSLAW